MVSTALDKMLEIARARYPTDRWNIYARTGLGRRQLRRRQRPLRVAARRRGAADVPVFRLCRGRRRDGRQPYRARRATAICGAPIARSRRRIRISRCGGSAIRPRSSRCSTNYLQRGASVPDTRYLRRPRLETRGAAVQRAELGFRARCARSMTRSSRSRSTNSGSMSTRCRSRSSPRSRCSTPMPRSACR